MKKVLISILALSAIIVVLNAQDTAPVPYVASVKKNAGGFGAQMRIAPGMISANGVPVRLLMRQAFGQLQDFQLVGGPDWINSDRFDIEAKLEGGGPMSPQVIQSVLRQILEERFSLKVHRETRELPIYALVLARSDGRLGPNLKPSSPECTTLMTSRGSGPAPGPDGRGGVMVSRGGPPPGGGGPPPDGRGGPGRAGGPPPLDFDAPPVCGQRGGGFGRMRAGGTTMEQFATMISGTAQRVVIDKTGLTGYYDIALTYTPSGDQLPQGAPPPGAPAPPPIDPDGPSFFTAIQEQLGLKLDNQRGPVEVVVIDSIQQPTEN
jgi:uncharacterized protein (TIGR03435 family)